MPRIAIAIANGIEAGQVAEGLTGTQHVVSADGGLRVGELHLSDMRPGLFQFLRRFFHLLPHLSGEPLGIQERGHDADRMPFTPSSRLAVKSVWMGWEVQSSGSLPQMAFMTKAASSTVRAKGPT